MYLNLNLMQKNKQKQNKQAVQSYLAITVSLYIMDNGYTLLDNGHILNHSRHNN